MLCEVSAISLTCASDYHSSSGMPIEEVFFPSLRASCQSMESIVESSIGNMPEDISPSIRFT